MYILNQKIELDYKLPLSEEINSGDPILTDIFDTFESLSGDHQCKVGDSVVALEISAMPFGKPKEVWIEGTYQPLTIEEITPDYVEFSNGQQKPSRRIVQLRLWRDLVMFDSPQSAEEAITWMMLKSGESDIWTLKSYVDETPITGVEENQVTDEGYGGINPNDPYGTGSKFSSRIHRGDFVKARNGKTYRVVGDNGAQYAVQEFLGGGKYGNTVTMRSSDLTKISTPGDAKMAAEGKLTPGQKRAGQVSATEPAKSIGSVLGKPEKKHPFQGRLVGANESIETDVEEGVVQTVDYSKFKPGVQVQHQFFPIGTVVKLVGNNVVVKVEHNGKERLFSVPPSQLTIIDDNHDTELSRIIDLSKPKN